MVSLQSSGFSPNRRKASPDSEDSSQKRKWEELYDCREQVFEKRSKAGARNFMADTELHFETPLPSEWQRCLDIQVLPPYINIYIHTHTQTNIYLSIYVHIV